MTSASMGLPKVFLQKMQERLGNEFDDFIESLKESPPVSIRLNPEKGKGLFESEEPVPWCEFGKYLKERPAFVWDPLYHAGAYYAQEASSMLLHNFIDFNSPFGSAQSDGMRILDLCAAPGGKSSLLLSYMKENSLMVSNEMVGKRASILYENLAKWGDYRSVVTQNRPADFLNFKGYFDVVLVDAPCSGEGMFRKDRGAVEQWSEGLVKQCSIVQKEILKIAVELVAPEGLLIYSTCTFEAAENEENLQWLYANYGKNLEPVLSKAFENLRGLYPLKIPTSDGRVQPAFYCFPHRMKGEGLFLSAIRVNHNKKNIPKALKTNLRKASKNEFEASKNFIRPDSFLNRSGQETCQVFPFQNELYVFPESLEKDMALMTQMRFKKLGTNIGTLNRDVLIPSHELAMSGLENSVIPHIELNLEDALKYMQRKPLEITLENIPNGWIIFTYKGRNLGWAKNLGTRINNHYPSEWRIRKEPEWQSLVT